MSARRLDPGDWNDRPHPRTPRAPWWVLLRHTAELEFGAIVAGLACSTRVAARSWPHLAVMVLVVGTALCSAEVREMVLGQIRRVVMRRRLQQAFLELAVCSRHHRLTPTVIRSAAIPGGTLLRVWVPVGLTVDDIARRRHALAEAVHVDEVHVERRPGRLNTVEIILIRHGLGRKS